MSPPPRYDLALFEQLNEEYGERPRTRSYRRRMFSLPASGSEDAQSPTLAELSALLENADEPGDAGRDVRSETERARAPEQLSSVLASPHVDLRGKTVLDLGCGHGWVTGLTSKAGAAQTIGTDLVAYPTWAEHARRNVRFVAGDISREALVAEGSIDLVISTTAFEHITRPLQMLRTLHGILAPGGLAWLHFNLYTAQNASHVYRDVSFPWPHLLFEDEVCIAFHRKHCGRALRFSWVNRMTIAHYLQAAGEIGFEVLDLSAIVTPVDVAFYERFEDKLGRYPALDLESDFATLVLARADAPVSHGPTADYQARQAALDESLLTAAPRTGSAGRRSSRWKVAR